MPLFRSLTVRVLLLPVLVALVWVTATAQTRADLSASFAEVAKSTAASVVTIETLGRLPGVTVRDDNITSNSLDDNLRDSIRPQRRAGAVGSGFIVDRAGFVLTNLHVVEETSRISVRLGTGEEFVARIVGTDEETDLAVLKIDARRDLPVMKFGDSDKLRVGEWVLAFGSPFGLAESVTAGIVSQINRETPETYQFPKRFIQTDAAINRGNSGGPLVNMTGEAVGVNSVIATSTGGSNGIGFALPINDALRVVREIIAKGKVRRGFLGVGLETVRAEYANVFGLAGGKGAIVLNINDPKSAAALSGLQPGDVITEFDGTKVESAGDLIAKVSATMPEKVVEVVYFRENGASMERRTTNVKLAERPSNNRIIDDTKPRPLGPRPSAKPFGLTLLELTSPLIEAYKLGDRKGLLVKEIDPTGQLFELVAPNGDPAIVEGDLVQRVNREFVSDLKSFNTAAARLKKGDAVVLQILSNNRSGRGLQMKIVQFTMD